MSAFSLLPVFWQTLLPLVLFGEAVLELGLFLYQIFRSSRPVRSLPCAVHFVILLMLLFAVTQGDPDEGKDAFLLGAPWLIFVIVIALAAIHFVIAFPREYRRRKNELSPSSIKLPIGIFFADADGRIILGNHRMRRLSFDLSGHELQVAEDLEKALTHPKENVIVKDSCYLLPDNTVWQFQTQNITVDGDDRWQQVTAQNVTELYNSNLREAAINKELQEVNRRLRQMYERMADDIREKESLDLKIYIHDTIGRSLLTIRDIIDSGGNTDKKLEALQEAIGVLTSNRTAPHGTMEEVKQNARALGVAVEIEGYLPSDSVIEELTVAAAKECVTNCIKHAGGNAMKIRIVARNDLYDITITNNGAVPDGPICEGSGLTSLRRSIEAAGGEMHTAYKPRFALILTLPGKEKDL